MGRVVEPGQPQWLPEDVDLALEWAAEQSVRHNGCGHPLDETTDIAADERQGRYKVRKLRCWACYETEKAAAEAAASTTSDRYGLIFVAELRDDVERAEVAGDN